MKRDYWVWWTYVANFCEPFRVAAESVEGAAERVFRTFGDDQFREKATMWVITSRADPVKLKWVEGRAKRVGAPPR